MDKKWFEVSPRRYLIAFDGGPDPRCPQGFRKPGEIKAEGGRPRLSSQFPLREAGRTLLLVVFLAASLARIAQAQGTGEYQVKAAFLYNFAKFVEWPSEAFSNGRSLLVVGVIGDDPFGGDIDQMINGKTVNGRQLVIKRLRWGQNLRDCHILFISSSERNRLAQIIENLRGANVLTVGEMDKFAEQGGLINFIMENNKVRFEINTNVAEQAHLKISSKLLGLAKTVLGGQRVGKN